VNDDAARWAEYLLLRSNHFHLLSRPIDARNERWAIKWSGRMPQPWVEAGCKMKRQEQPKRAWWNRFIR
jgi:hypothetical protein